MRPSAPLVALAALLTAAAPFAAACNRAPEEPAPIASSRAPAQEVTIPPAPRADATLPRVESAAKAERQRCIKPTPDVAPPPVSAVPAAQCPKDPEHEAALPTVTLSAAEATRGATKIEAELARSDRARERGLMFRTAMADDHGMLFEMGAHVIQSFWMKNTCLPLDMLFLDEDGTIVGLLENVPTLNLEERTVGCPSSYVLEMNAGWARRHGVRAGQKITLPNPSSP
jgi:uncharacterized membrane protein (UPF0127 family)